MDVKFEIENSIQETTDSVGSEDQTIHLVGADSPEDEDGAINVSQGSLLLDPSGQYTFQAETGPGGEVSYHVVQVGQDGQQQIVGTTGGPQLVQTDEGLQVLTPGAIQTADGIQVINTASLAASQLVQHPAIVSSPSAVTDAAIGQVAAGNNQFYVMMSPQDVLQNNTGHRLIAPGTSATPLVETNRSSRDDRRRASHNEVERRRRDKMNNWIVQLSKLIPDCGSELSKSGQIKSKSGILSKACEYITELRTANSTMTETLKDHERVSIDNELLRSQLEELRHENELLEAALQQHGIVVPTDMESGDH